MIVSELQIFGMLLCLLLAVLAWKMRSFPVMTVSAFGCTGTTRLPYRWSTLATPYAARSRLAERPTTAQVSPLSRRTRRTVSLSPYCSGMGISSSVCRPGRLPRLVRATPRATVPFPALRPFPPGA